TLSQDAFTQGKLCAGITLLKDKQGRPLCTQACLWLWMQGHPEPTVVKCSVPTLEGPQRDVEVTVTPIKDQEQKTVGLVHVLRDISDQEQLVRLKERFLLSVSHELRTPLSALTASVELLLNQFPALAVTDRTRLLETTQRSIVRLQNLIANLLDLGSIQA